MEDHFKTWWNWMCQHNRDRFCLILWLSLSVPKWLGRSASLLIYSSDLASKSNKLSDLGATVPNCLSPSGFSVLDFLLLQYFYQLLLFSFSPCRRLRRVDFVVLHETNMDDTCHLSQTNFLVSRLLQGRTVWYHRDVRRGLRTRIAENRRNHR